VTPGRLTKHAPELEYPSLSADAIKQRFETDLKSQGFDPETTFLKTDDQTLISRAAFARARD
ncbi:MAG: hypothetical protein HOI45_04200, partial [Rhodospirillaceae bacterium]|jgi:hypothetical protein|nr:hypothetical protein [Rhodospirillaceae bacterium]